MKQSELKNQKQSDRTNGCSLKDGKHLVIGFTGGIGAGKSTVLGLIQKYYDVHVIMADEAGHVLMEPGRSVYKALISEYGTEILDSEQKIDKQKLAKIAFKDEVSQKRINEIEHPIIKDYIKYCIAHTKRKVCFVEAALLSEGKLLDTCDKVISVIADDDVRLLRLMKDRGYSREKCVSIMEKQLSNGEFASISDYTIPNNGDLSETMEEVHKVMEALSVPLKVKNAREVVAKGRSLAESNSVSTKKEVHSC